MTWAYRGAMGVRPFRNNERNVLLKIRQRDSFKNMFCFFLGPMVFFLEQLFFPYFVYSAGVSSIGLPRQGFHVLAVAEHGDVVRAQGLGVVVQVQSSLVGECPIGLRIVGFFSYRRGYGFELCRLHRCIVTAVGLSTVDILAHWEFSLC